ncbi:hypothetical protein [Algoriphagus sp. Y33]|uniref:hypothetical protein n=1 Tax=Algoriphagus sp. Y33 TaxID=2772483 RepID=UPI0017811942|nr:hypothetical protein [Algoriphagus sp. Y33]
MKRGRSTIQALKERNIDDHGIPDHKLEIGGRLCSFFSVFTDGFGIVILADHGFNSV